MHSKHIKRTLAGSALALVASLALGACSAPAPEADLPEVTELTIPTAETPWLPSYQKIAAEYEAETGVKINLTTFPMDGLLTQQANAAQSGSNAFDVFQMNEQWVGQFYDSQWVQPLADVDPEFAWDEGLIEFDGVGRWDADLRRTSADGEPYALPINGNIQLFMYRTDLYEQLDLDVPTTWEDVIDNGQAARDAGVVADGYVLRGKTPTFDFSAVLFSEGGSWFEGEADGDFTPTVDTPEMREALEKFARLAAVGPAAPQTVAQAEATSLMQGGGVLQATLVAAVAAPLENPEASLVAGKIGYATLPGGTPVSGTWTLGIPTGLPEERAQAAYEFITWLTSQATMEKWAELGGVTTRSDIETDRPELLALVDSEADIRAGLRYPFAPQMLQVTEPVIGEYLAGTIDIEEAITRMEDGLTRVVEEAGFVS